MIIGSMHFNKYKQTDLWAICSLPYEQHRVAVITSEKHWIDDWWLMVVVLKASCSSASGSSVSLTVVAVTLNIGESVICYLAISNSN